MSKSGEPDQRVRIFISYAHQDEEWREKIVTAASALVRREIAVTWHDRKILPGSKWQSEITERLDSADIVVCLVSADFIASDYCYEEEFKRALRRKNSNEMHVIPVIVRPVDSWEDLPLGHFQALPPRRKGTRAVEAISEWENEDRALAEVAKGIRLRIEDVVGKRRGREAADQIGTGDESGAHLRDEPVHNGRRMIQLYVPNGLETRDDFLRMWDFLKDQGHELVSKNGWQLCPPCVGNENLRQVVGWPPPVETILLVAVDSRTLEDSDGENWFEEEFSSIADSETNRHMIVGVIADGCSPELAFRLRDHGARAAIPLSRLGDPDWVWPGLDEMIRGSSSRFVPPFERLLGDLSRRKKNRIAVAGIGKDAWEIRSIVKPISTRLSKRSPLMIDPKSSNELEIELSELKTTAAVILRVRKHSDAAASVLCSELAAHLSGMGSGKVKTFCVAKQRELPDWWGNWSSFAYYDYTCNVDLALRLYEWLLVAQEQGESK